MGILLLYHSMKLTILVNSCSVFYGVIFMTHQTDHEKRKFIRLRYPQTKRPTVELLGHEYPLCEISEEGMRLLFKSTSPFSLGIQFSGIIHFCDDEDIPIEGIALRQHVYEVAVKLTKRISPTRIDKEKQYISS